eukprot:TRINITY_DN39614_c0_g1_i3.p1 TRINITY_DN39614_c0_g1~~TRINITY_DN39614_c0_g1_i3.p1  ORF type:complete len:523 (+),score=120.11 TRINITY_DN39614_c0_g1_i3:62-1630(+)
MKQRVRRRRVCLATTLASGVALYAGAAWNRDGAALAPSPPGPSTLGALFGFATNIFPWKYMLQLRKDGYEDVARVDLGPAGEFMFLMSAKSVYEVSVPKSSAFARRVTVPLFETLELDKGIVYEQGAMHKRNKGLCLPAFEAKNSMLAFYPGVQAEFDAMRSRWRSQCEASGGGSAALDLYAEMRKFTLDIVLRVTFGLGDAANSYARADELSDTIKGYLERIVATANEVPPIYQVVPRLSPNYVAVVDNLLPTLRELVDDVIAERRRSMASDRDPSSSSQSQSRADLLSVLLQDDAITDKEISQILFDIIIAGSDTTASTLAAAAYVLHEPRHAEQLRRAQEEAAQVDASTLAFEEIRAKLPYTTAVIREVMRLYPPVPFFGRTSVEEEEVCGYGIKTGSTMCISPWYLGRDSFAWGPTVEDFEPERWIANSTHGGASSTFQWLPFGAGMRGCLGVRLAMMEASVGLARLLRDFNLKFEREGELEFSYDITLNLEGTTMCKVWPRSTVDPRSQAESTTAFT